MATARAVAVLVLAVALVRALPASEGGTASATGEHDDPLLGGSALVSSGSSRAKWGSSFVDVPKHNQTTPRTAPTGSPPLVPKILAPSGALGGGGVVAGEGRAAVSVLPLPGPKVQPVTTHIAAGEAALTPTAPAYRIAKSYFINLESERQRRNAFTNMAHDVRLDATRWPAVKVGDYQQEFQPASQYFGFTKNKHLPEARAEARKSFILGVYLSHRTLLQEIAEDRSAGPDDLFLIFEDDALLKEGWRDTLLAKMARVPNDWDIVRFGFWGSSREADKVNEDVFAANGPATRTLNSNNDLEYFYMGMHAVAVRQRTLPHLLGYLDSRDEIKDIDVMMVNNGDGLRSYVLSTKIAFCPYGH